MWTYLIIFLSAIVFISIFVRRAVLLGKFSKLKSAPKEEAPVVSEDTPKVLKKDKVKADALCDKGRQLIKQGGEEDAVKHFVQALALDPGNTDAQHELAMLYLNKQMFNAAAALFKQLSEVLENPIYYSHLGFALYQQNQFDEAKKAYQKAITLDPSRPQRFISLAQVYRATNEPELSVIAINKAIDLEKDNVDFLFLLAELQNEMQRFEDCKLILKKILSIEPGNKEAVVMLKKLELPPQ
ncbi:MAG: tetratricopeptide repeat protein [Candidatus Gracilibacteria bacterium]|jgi:cytochrome c-type biogenesis protein CcmH/NrfG